MEYSAVLALLFAAPVAAASVAPDVLVVCPASFRPALAPWEAYRRDQGHELLVVEPSPTAEELQATIQGVAGGGRLKYLLLVGDVPAESTNLRLRQPTTVPTQYVAAHVNTTWGSEPSIATDQVYADVNGDQIPDLAVGRIPVDSSGELAAVVRKVLRYEQRANVGMWRRQIQVVAGAGGFGPLADALIEAAARQVIQQTVPPGHAVGLTLANSRSETCPPADTLCPLIRQQVSGGCLVWIYLGHGLPTELDRVPMRGGARPMFSVEDVSQLRSGDGSPLAVLIACYTGAIDAPEDGLAEELVCAEAGPVAVIAATRVTMPYGNAVLGRELLRSCFCERCECVGDMLRLAGQRTLSESPEDALRTSLDAMARGLSPLVAAQPSLPKSTASRDAHSVDLAGERAEHVAMYHLLGDPLLRVRLPRALSLHAPSRITAGDELTVNGHSDMKGECLIEFVSNGDRRTVDEVLAVAAHEVGIGPFRVSFRVPGDALGQCAVRAFVKGEDTCAVGATNVFVRRQPFEQASRLDDGQAVR